MVLIVSVHSAAASFQGFSPFPWRQGNRKLSPSQLGLPLPVNDDVWVAFPTFTPLYSMTLYSKDCASSLPLPLQTSGSKPLLPAAIPPRAAFRRPHCTDRWQAHSSTLNPKISIFSPTSIIPALPRHPHHLASPNTASASASGLSAHRGRTPPILSLFCSLIWHQH